MGRKKNRIPDHLFENLEIIDITEDGKGLGRHEGKVVFVKGAVPGDVVHAKVYKNKGRYFEAEIATLAQASSQRTQPVCDHFGTCGGCKWQHLSYEAQLFYKEKQVKDAIERIGGLDIKDFRPILGCEQIFHYRNKMEFSFSNRKWLTESEVASGESIERNALGFHVPGRYDRVVDIQECHLQGGISNPLRNFVRELAIQNGWGFYDVHTHEGLLRNMFVRLHGTQSLLVMVFAKNDVEAIQTLLSAVESKFPELTSIQYIINEKANDSITDQTLLLYKGPEHLEEKMGALTFRIAPKSFFQTNSLQAYPLYQKSLELADIQPTDVVYDLYTGTGTIANFVAKKAQRVVGLEYVPEAIADAKVNSEINNITNTAFFAGDMKQILTHGLVTQHGKPDVIITDPPRGGMDKEVTLILLELAPRTIVYISCNPSTQARDLAILKEKYEVLVIQPVDMFPHTQHVENIALLQLKS